MPGAVLLTGGGGRACGGVSVGTDVGGSGTKHGSSGGLHVAVADARSLATVLGWKTQNVGVTNTPKKKKKKK